MKLFNLSTSIALFIFLSFASGKTFAATDAQLEADFSAAKIKVRKGYWQVSKYPSQPEYKAAEAFTETMTEVCKRTATDTMLEKTKGNYNKSVLLYHRKLEMEKLVKILESRLTFITGSPVTL